MANYAHNIPSDLYGNYHQQRIDDEQSAWEEELARRVAEMEMARMAEEQRVEAARNEAEQTRLAAGLNKEPFSGYTVQAQQGLTALDRLDMEEGQRYGAPQPAAAETSLGSLPSAAETRFERTQPPAGELSSPSFDRWQAQQAAPDQPTAPLPEEEAIARATEETFQQIVDLPREDYRLDQQAVSDWLASPRPSPQELAPERYFNPTPTTGSPSSYAGPISEQRAAELGRMPEDVLGRVARYGELTAQPVEALQQAAEFIPGVRDAWGEGTRTQTPWQTGETVGPFPLPSSLTMRDVVSGGLNAYAPDPLFGAPVSGPAFRSVGAAATRAEQAATRAAFPAARAAAEMPAEVAQWLGRSTPAPQQAAVPMGAGGFQPSQVQRPIWDMSYEDIAAARHRVAAEEKNGAVMALGEEGARRYNAAERTVNSSSFVSPERMEAAERTIQQLEAGLTPEQERLLFGLRPSGHGPPRITDDFSASELRSIESAMGGLDWESPAALGASLRWAITKVRPGTRPEDMSLTELGAYMQLRHAAEQASAMGWDSAEISRLAVQGAGSRFNDEDARFMLDAFLKPPGSDPKQRLLSAGIPTPDLAGAVTGSLAAQAGMDENTPLEERLAGSMMGAAGGAAGGRLLRNAIGPGGLGLGSGGLNPDQAARGDELLRNAARMWERPPAVPPAHGNPAYMAIQKHFTDEFADVNRVGQRAEDVLTLYRGLGGAVDQRWDDQAREILQSTHDIRGDYNSYIKFQRDLEVANLPTSKTPRKAGGGIEMAVGDTEGLRELRETLGEHTFADVMSHIKYEQLDQILGATKTGRLASAGVENASDPAVALARLRETVGEETWARMEQADALRMDAVRQMRDELRDAGFFTQEQVDFFNQYHPHYNPVRQMEIAEQLSTMSTPRNKAAYTNTLRRLSATGHAADTEEPTVSFAKFLAEGQRKLFQQRVVDGILESAAGNPEYAREVVRVPNVRLRTGPVTGPKALANAAADLDIAAGTVATNRSPWEMPGMIPHWEDGKLVLYRVPEAVEKVVKNLDGDKLLVTDHIFRAMNAPFRAVFTTHNPAFIARNIAVDFVTSKFERGWEGVRRIPQGWGEIARDGPQMQELRRIGGDYATFTQGYPEGPMGVLQGMRSSNPRDVKKANDAMMRQITRSGGYVIRHPKELFNLYSKGELAKAFGKDVVMGGAAAGVPAVVLPEDDPRRNALIAAGLVGGPLYRRAVPRLAQITEAAAHLSAYQGALARGAGPESAAAIGRRTPVDFARSGETMRHLSSVFLFLNPAVQGGLVPFRTLRDTPSSRYRAAALAATMISAYAYNQSIDPGAWDAINQDEKDTFFVVLLPGSEKAPDGNGYSKINRISVPLRELGMFTAPLVRTLDAMRGVESFDPVKDVLDMTRNFTPGISGANVPFVPQFIRPVGEQVLGKDFYTGRDITPKSLAVQPKEMQEKRPDEVAMGKYGSATSALWTSPATRQLGEQLNLSPIQMEQLAHSVGGGVARTAEGYADFLVGRPGSRPPVIGEVARGLNPQSGGRTDEDRYDKADEQYTEGIALSMDRLRANEEYQKATPERKRQMERVVNEEQRTVARMTAEIESQRRDLGLPNRYSGINDPHREAQIARIVERGNAREDDPRNNPALSADEYRIWERYRAPRTKRDYDMRNPAYLRELERMQQRNRDLRGDVRRNEPAGVR